MCFSLQDLFTVPETEDCYSKLATVCQVLAHMGSNNASTQEGDPQSKVLCIETNSTVFLVPINIRPCQFMTEESWDS